MHKIITQLSNVQIEVVKEIGFEDMLHLQLTTTIMKMLPWLVNNFDQSSRYFEIQSGTRFAHTMCMMYLVSLSMRERTSLDVK